METKEIIDAINKLSKRAVQEATKNVIPEMMVTCTGGTLTVSGMHQGVLCLKNKGQIAVVANKKTLVGGTGRCESILYMLFNDDQDRKKSKRFLLSGQVQLKAWMSTRIMPVFNGTEPTLILLPGATITSDEYNSSRYCVPIVRHDGVPDWTLLILGGDTVEHAIKGTGLCAKVTVNDLRLNPEACKE